MSKVTDTVKSIIEELYGGSIEDFKKSPSYQYYLIGKAHGVFLLYRAIEEYLEKGYDISLSDWFLFVKDVVSDSSDFKNYFDKFLDVFYSNK